MSPSPVRPSRRLVLGAGVAALGALAATGRIEVSEAAPRPRHRIVVNNVSESVIVVEEPGNPFVTDAAAELQDTIRQACNVTVPIVQPGDTRPRTGSIRIGRGPVAIQQMAAHNVVLEPEEYWIQTRGTDLLIVGYDIDPFTTTLPDVGTPNQSHPQRSPATSWGVQYVLDRHLGVRWLWPGPGGTVIPTVQNFTLPVLSVRGCPAAELRHLRNVHYIGRPPRQPLRLLDDAAVATMEREIRRWQEHHQLGQRTDLISGHSFTNWWNRFGTNGTEGSHPDWFGTPPDSTYALPSPDKMKLNMTKPGVADQIIADWTAKGRPNNWKVGPNDGGTGFDTTAESMAMDHPLNQSAHAVWTGQANLSARHIKFWNELLARMRQHNPKVRLLSLAYSAYRTAPAPASGITSADGLVLAYTVAPWWNAEWQAWSDLGAQLTLRPNWWNSGATSPVLPLHLEGEFHLFAREHGALGFDYDSIFGAWATQGLRYYLIARLNARPDLGVEDVINEYCACFGAGASAIRAYVDYWEEHTMQVSYPLGSTVPLDPQGLFPTLIAAHGYSNTGPLGSQQVFPHLYTDAVLNPALDLLDQATSQAAGDSAALSRIQFLRDGLTEVAAKRRTMVAALGSSEFTTAAAELKEIRTEMTPRHVIWGEFSYWSEIRYFNNGVRTYDPSAV